jgi:membrane protease YdiL (CAAX protease family)
MESEKVIQQSEFVQPVTKKVLRKPVNQVGLAMILQTVIQFIVTIVIQAVLVIGLTITNALQSQIDGGEFNALTFTNEMAKILKQPLVLLVCLLASSLLGNTIPYLVCAKKTGVSFKSLYKKSDKSISYIVKMAVITIAAGNIFSYSQYLFDFLLKPFSLKSTSPDLLKFPAGSPAAIVLYFLAVCIVAPITEEFIFRGVALNVFKRYGTRFAIVASALFFGLFHANLYQTPYAIVIGIVLAYVAVETQSIIPSTIIHFVNNAASFTLSWLMASFPKYENAIGFGFEGIIIPAGIILFILWLKNRKKLSFEAENTPGVSGTKLIFTSWSCLITIIIYVVFIIMSIDPIA